MMLSRSPEAADLLEEALALALTALRTGDPDRAVAVLLRARPLAAAVGALPHAALLLRLAQARLAQARTTCEEPSAGSPGAAALRAAQAHASAREALDRLHRVGAADSSLGERARTLVRAAGDELLSLTRCAA